MTHDEASMVGRIVAQLDLRTPWRFKWCYYVGLVDKRWACELAKGPSRNPERFRVTTPWESREVSPADATAIMCQGWRAVARDLLTQRDREAADRKAEKRRYTRTSKNRPGSCIQCKGPTSGQTNSLCRGCMSWAMGLPAWLDDNDIGQQPLTLWLHWRQDHPFVEADRKAFFTRLNKLKRISDEQLEEFGVMKGHLAGRWADHVGMRFPGEAA